MYYSGVEQWLHCQLGLEDSHPQTEEMFLQDDFKGGLGRAPVVPQSPSLGVRRALKRLVRGLKAPKMLKFVTICFPMSWPFAIIAETRRVLVSFRSLHLLELKIKNFGGLPFR